MAERKEKRKERKRKKAYETSQPSREVGNDRHLESARDLVVLKESILLREATNVGIEP
jgi:hypothetical protein